MFLVPGCSRTLWAKLCSSKCFTRLRCCLFLWWVSSYQSRPVSIFGPGTFPRLRPRTAETGKAKCFECDYCTYTVYQYYGYVWELRRDWIKQTSESTNHDFKLLIMSMVNCGTLWNIPSETGDCSDSPKGWDSDGSHLSVTFCALESSKGQQLQNPSDLSPLSVWSCSTTGWYWKGLNWQDAMFVINKGGAR